MKVLITPEDQEHDRYVVKPVVEALFNDLDLAARIEVLPEPRLRGADDALDPQIVEGILRENPMIDLFLLVIDNDCDRRGNGGKARALSRSPWRVSCRGQLACRTLRRFRYGRRMRAYGAATCLVLCVALFSVPTARAASGDGLVLAVPELETPPTMIGLGGQVLKEIQSAALAEGYSLLDAQALEAKLGREEADRLRRCAGQPTCYASRLRNVGAQRAVVGSLSRNERAYLLRLYLVDLSTGQTVADVDRDILIASRRFSQDVAEAVPRLMRGEREARGTLRVRTQVPVRDAEVSIDGQVVGHAPVEVALKPGKYELRVTRRHHLPVRRFVDVFADKVSDEEVRLLREPGAPPDEEELPALVVENPSGDSSRPFAIRAPAWTAAGVALALGGVGGYFGLRASELQGRLEDGFDAQRGVYAGTRRDVIEGHANARRANAFFAGAAVAATAAVVLTVFDVGAPSSKGTIEAAPTAGPGGAGVMLGGRF